MRAKQFFVEERAGCFDTPAGEETQRPAAARQIGNGNFNHSSFFALKKESINW
jgi:hypothetical protein